jgi:tRNA pseudouridine32 synthase/23S rRNA pseudouridine746 synthase
MVKSRTYLLAQVVDGEPNTETRIELLEQRGGMGRYKLEPHTGKTHQLRVHLASLGIGILHDPFYPVLLDQAPDDFERPLQLLARGISFTDPISGEPVEYRSRLELSEWAVRGVARGDTGDAPRQGIAC